MVTHLRLAKLSLLALCLVGCNLLPVSPPVTPAAPASIEIPTAAGPAATATETAMEESPTATPKPCEIVAESEVTVFQRPSPDAAVFGSMPPGSSVVGEGRTADGWFGFDPGVAQAANIGIFRLRWVDGSSGVRLEGACDGLPELVAPPAGICFTMPMDEVHVYAEPDVSSEVVATMLVGDYAAVIARTTEDWAKVDLSVGNTELDATGWIQGGTLNLNGPCEDLPTVEP